MVKIPPPIWGLGYLAVALAVSAFAGWPRLPGLPLVPPAVVLIVSGFALAGSAAWLFLSEGTAIYPTAPINLKLVVAGPFRLTRNPMYVGLILIMLGVAFAVGTWPTFLVPIAMFLTVHFAHVPFEEQKMRRQFGAEYDAYCKAVRRWV